MTAATLTPVATIPTTQAVLPASSVSRTLRTGRGGPVRLGDLLLHVSGFETRRAGESFASPPRTVGHVGLVAAGGGRGLAAVGPEQAVAVALRDRDDPAPADAARGKVVFCNARGDSLVFQADQQYTTAALCACGNATGAAAAVQARLMGRRHLGQAVKLPDGWVEASASVSRTAEGTWRVEQAWCGVQLHAEQARLGGRDVAVCTGTFNEYLIVRLPDRAALDSFGLDDALHLWQEGRRFSCFADPLRSRLAAVAPAGGRAAVKFYTCGRAHPGAPLTGLAVLAVAARKIAWLASLTAASEVENRRGVDVLPAARATSRGAEVRFPTIDVTLRGV